jgi:hypothetical protein
MVSEYDIFMGKNVVGTAEVERQGLYYHFVCRCRLSGDALCRVMVECDGYHENLGILVPWGKSFGLTTRVPMKRFGSGKLNFRVLPKHPSGQGTFIAVYPDEPFAYLSRLKSAFLEVRNGQVGVVLKDPESDPQGSDQIPKHRRRLVLR